jgi:hypothetical protein
MFETLERRHGLALLLLVQPRDRPAKRQALKGGSNIENLFSVPWVEWRDHYAAVRARNN